MNTKLPEPLSSYYEAVNARDIETTIGVFAADGVVWDEGEEHRGRDAIRAWTQKVTAKYVLIATGGRPNHGTEIPGIEHVISSDEAFHLPQLPKRVVVQGG